MQNVSGSGIVISTSTGDTALSMSAGGAIDFSKNIHLVCTLDKPIKNIAFGNFIANDKVNLNLKYGEILSRIFWNWNCADVLLQSVRA